MIGGHVLDEVQPLQYIYIYIHNIISVLVPPIVRQVLPEVVVMLPNDDTGTDLSTDATSCLCHILNNLSQSNSQHVRAIVNQGALPKIINISSKDNGWVVFTSTKNYNNRTRAKPHWSFFILKTRLNTKLSLHKNITIELVKQMEKFTKKSIKSDTICSHNICLVTFWLILVCLLIVRRSVSKYIIRALLKTSQWISVFYYYCFYYYFNNC